MSQSPRVNRNEAVSLLFVFLTPYRNADVPARNTNTGAQKWVIQRVKKSRGVVVARLVGSAYHVPAAKYIRTWSNAMMIITSPRRKSMDSILGFPIFTFVLVCCIVQRDIAYQPS